MDYKSQVASAVSHVEKAIDYSNIMVAELESGWSIAYQQEESNFVADQWFPQIAVDKIAGYYPKWAKANAFTNKAGTWRPGSMPPAGELGIDAPGFYACERYAFQSPLLADLPFVADPAYPLEKATTQFVTDVLRLNKEIKIANSYFKTGVWGMDITGVNSGETWAPGEVTTGETFRRFNDADSDPITLFKDIKMGVKKSIGVKPNTLILGEQVYEAMRINPQLISLYRNPQGSEKVPTKLNEQMIAQALDIEKIIVAGAMYNTTPNASTCTLDWVFGKSAWCGYVDTPGQMKTIAAMNLSFNDPLGGFSTAMEQVPDLLTHTTWYRGFQCWCPVVMTPDAGVFLYTAIA